MQPSNAVEEKPKQGQVHLFDLHRLKHHPFSWRLWQMKDLAQLLYSSEIPGIDGSDRLRFWRSYMGSKARGWSATLLRYCIVMKWRRYRQHNLRKNRTC